MDNLEGKTIKSMSWQRTVDGRDPPAYWIELTFTDGSIVYLQGDDPYVEITIEDNKEEVVGLRSI